MQDKTLTLHQIAFDLKSAQMINPLSSLIMNNSPDKYFENSVIKRIFSIDGEISPEDKIGFLSYRYEEKNKTKINFEQLHKSDADIIVMQNCWANVDVIEDSVKYHGEGFKIAFNYLLDNLGCSFDEIKLMDRNIPLLVHQNAVVAKGKVWNKYIPVLEKAMWLLENDELLLSLCDQDSGYRGGLSKEILIEVTGKPFYTLHTFLLERLWSVFIHALAQPNGFSVDLLTEQKAYYLPRVLVCAPQHETKMYAFEKWFNRVKELSYQNYDVFLADNSPTEDNVNYMKSLGINCQWIPSNKDGLIFTIADSHQACADYALKNGFDYVLHLETDIVPPRDVIESLLIWKKSVIGGHYDLFHGSKRKSMIQEMEFYDRSITNFNSAQQVEEMEPLYFDGNIHRVYHIGLGCILINVNLFKKIKFRAMKGVNLHPDSFFAEDCMSYKIPVFIDTNIQCKHYNQSWLSNMDEIQNNLKARI